MDATPAPLLFLPTLLLIFFSSNTCICTAADTLFAGQALIENQTLKSQGGVFELGFFSPGKSLNYYIGTWYKRAYSSDGKKVVVWVGNRDQPLRDLYTSELKLLENGNLVLLNQSKIPVWSTNSTSNIRNSYEAVLGDDGNLVLRDRLNTSVIIWQSFDNPTDTWLPGAKMRYDNRTKKSQKMISWKNLEDPAQGIFSNELEPENGYVMKWKGYHQYFSTGPWDGEMFSLTPELRPGDTYNYTYVSNVNESYFVYTVFVKSVLARFVMDVSGQGKFLLWLDSNQQWNLFNSLPRQQCEVYACCGPFSICSEKGAPLCQCLQGFEQRSPKDWNLHDMSGGCVRKTSLECESKDKFLQMPNMQLPVNSNSLVTVSAEDCKLACLSNCSCFAYAYTTKCLIWYSDLLNIQQLDDGGDNLYVRLAASELSSRSKESTPWAIIVGAIAGTIVLGFVLLLIWRWQKRKLNFRISKKVEGSLVAFTYRELQTATRYFSEKMGGGSFGSVFKGTLPDSTAIAVKKLEGLHQGEKQFRAEVSTNGTIQHVNLVRLRGFCSEGTKRLLVYDFMPNGSLDSHLFHQDSSKALNWKTRYDIALGTARALAYLHEECRDCIIHCDIKPENILLDADFVPKVADFGLAKLLGREFSRVVTTMRGTIGYLAPEWSSGIAITAKADVYSYGMMLFEIISGRRNLKQSKDRKVWFFPTWAASKISEGQEVMSVLDDRLGGNADVEELTRAFRVACWCIQEEEVHRPTMGQVVQILEGLSEVTTPPFPKYLQVLVQNEELVNFFTEPPN